MTRILYRRKNYLKFRITIQIEITKVIHKNSRDSFNDPRAIIG